ncbi:MAG: hypothetical protein N3A54_01935 [Patescibacteria group bacterium]|nr:hypothetical protein [Patescibacteria group bacterium]
MNWFFSSGDAPFFFIEQLQTFSLFPNLWIGENEFGQSALPILWIDYPFRFITFLLFQLGFSWFWIDKFWWGLVLLLCVFCSYRFTKSWIGSLVYSTNTYILLLFDGGQIGVALAYGIFPLVVYYAMQFFSQHVSLRYAMKFGLSLGVLTFLDIRIAYIFYVFIFFLILKRSYEKKFIISKFIVLPFFIVLAINSFWIIPSLFFKGGITTSHMYQTSQQNDLSFFSVADFPHTLSLLHPNYPENIFGRVYFLKPEFLFIPVLAFSVFFIQKKQSDLIFFGILGLVGSFFAKGVHEPFGQVYEFFFRYVPGFFLFRDPTKWYVMTAVSYAILISGLFQTTSKKFIKLLFIVFWIFCLRYVFLGYVTGNMSPPSVSDDYIMLKNMLVNDRNFGRVLWLPIPEKHGFRNEIHPAVSVNSILSESSPSGIVRLFETDEVYASLRVYGISYVVVPEDTEKKIFLDDYSFNPHARNAIVEVLDRISYLQKHEKFKNLSVYSFSNLYDPIRFNGEGIPIASEKEDIWRMKLGKRENEGILHVDFSYDPHWKVEVGDHVISPIQSDRNFMKFIIPQGNEEYAVLRYASSSIASIAAIISWISVISLVLFIIIKR